MGLLETPKGTPADASQAPTTLVAVGLTALLSVGLTAQATAAPPPIPPSLVAQAAPRSQAPVTDDDLGSEKYKDVKATDSIRAHAWDRGTKTLDYKKADKYDQGRTGARRKMARGLIYAGAKFKNLSSAERKKIMAYKMSVHGPSGLDSTRGAHKALDCRGRSDTTSKNPKGPTFTVVWYFDSCTTSAIVDSLSSCAILGGVITALTWEVPYYGGYVLTVTGICILGWTVTDIAAKNSDIGAIYVKDNTELLTVGSQ